MKKSVDTSKKKHAAIGRWCAQRHPHGKTTSSDAESTETNNPKAAELFEKMVGIASAAISHSEREQMDDLEKMDELMSEISDCILGSASPIPHHGVVVGVVESDTVIHAEVLEAVKENLEEEPLSDESHGNTSDQHIATIG